MDKEKKQISIIITDLDDSEKVLTALDFLFKEIMLHYSEKEDLTDLIKLVGGCAVYFRRLLKVFGYTEEDLENEENEF